MSRLPITLASIGASIVVAGGLSACGSVVDREPDLIAGKEAFVSKCGSCHVLTRAGTKGIQGPNLDEAFHQALSEGFKRSTIRGVVARQIEEPNRSPQVDPATGKELIVMPANLVKGQDVENVSAYVAMVAAKSGEDTGRLADIGTAGSKGTAKESNGTLAIPANPDGQLAYEFADATAMPGAVKITSKNDSSVPHDIAIEGNGQAEKVGEEVQGGGVSEVDVTLKAGTYTFYCTVPGHREAGMEGKITVK